MKHPWLNYNVVKKARKRKNTMCEKFKQRKLTCDRLLFGQANKEYNKAMVDAQIKHEKTLAESLKENPKRFYNHEFCEDRCICRLSHYRGWGANH